MLVEEGVPERQVRVAALDGRLDQLIGALVKEPRLATLRVQVGVAAEERLERARLETTATVSPRRPRRRLKKDSETCLVPADEELAVGTVEEAADVGAAEGDAGHREREEHGHGDGQVRPLGHVVARPHGAQPLAAGEEGARQHERPPLELRTRQLAAHCALHLRSTPTSIGTPSNNGPLLCARTFNCSKRHRLTIFPIFT